MAKSVGQNELRKMMQKIKTGGEGSAAASKNPRLKKYKLNSRELALIEEQKRKEREQKSLSQQQKVKPTVVPVPPSDARPSKSILKNSGVVQKHDQVALSVIKSVEKATTSSESSSSAPDQQNRKRKIDGEPEETRKKSGKEAEQPEGEDKGSLPEGFFDDPILDAKARHVEYKNPEDEEWERFQKEISQEIETSQEKVIEETEESTFERQIEEVDEQLRAWQKVSSMEKKLEVLETNLKQKLKKDDDDDAEGSEEDSDDDADEDMMNWRKKC